MNTTSSQRRLRRRRKVALLIETSNAYARGLLQGVVQYIREHEFWSFYLVEQGRGDDPPLWLKGWKGDGIIARIETAHTARAVLQTGLPAVDVSAARLAPALPWVETDDQLIAQLAAEHFLERGFKHLAFCGVARFNWSRWRAQHFGAHVRKAGHACYLYSPRARFDDLAAQINHIARWLTHLPKPLGVMACYDIRGQQVLDACRLAGLVVPDEVAVIGVDNDSLLCELASPPLSSVIPNTHFTGYQAAALLDRIMAGEAVAPDAHLIAPIGVATRQSTDVLAVDDRDVVRAVRFIRAHACGPMNLAVLLQEVNLTRRKLESKFNSLLGRSVHEEILQVRLRRVKELLTGTDLPLHLIAERSGFHHAEYLSVAFKREIGVTPGSFRAEAKTGMLRGGWN